VTFENAAQRRADEIKARREAKEVPVLVAVPDLPCAHVVGAWVCVSLPHPAAPDQHYYAKDDTA
jgi:hypothetical protein